MRRALSLFAAAAISFVVGFAVSEIATRMPCQGEGLACNIDDAIGAYSVMIWSGLGVLIFGVILLIGRNRVSLTAGMALLFAPLLIFHVGNLVEIWQTIGLEPYKNFRQVMTMFVPPAITIITQWLILRYLLGPDKVRGPGATPKTETKPEPHPPGPTPGGGGFAGFPTE